MAMDFTNPRVWDLSHSKTQIPTAWVREVLHNMENLYYPSASCNAQRAKKVDSHINTAIQLVGSFFLLAGLGIHSWFRLIQTDPGQTTVWTAATYCLLTV